MRSKSWIIWALPTLVLLFVIARFYVLPAYIADRLPGFIHTEQVEISFFPALLELKNVSFAFRPCAEAVKVKVPSLKAHLDLFPLRLKRAVMKNFKLSLKREKIKECISLFRAHLDARRSKNRAIGQVSVIDFAGGEVDFEILKHRIHGIKGRAKIGRLGKRDISIRQVHLSARDDLGGSHQVKISREKDRQKGDGSTAFSFIMDWPDISAFRPLAMRSPFRPVRGALNVKAEVKLSEKKWKSHSVLLLKKYSIKKAGDKSLLSALGGAAFNVFEILRQADGNLRVSLVTGGMRDKLPLELVERNLGALKSVLGSRVKRKVKDLSRGLFFWKDQ